MNQLTINDNLRQLDFSSVICMNNLRVDYFLQESPRDRFRKKDNKLAINFTIWIVETKILSEPII